MIKIYNRESKSYEIEKVLGENYIKWTYESPIGKSFLNIFLKRKLFSKLYGFFCDSKRSVKKIDNIIEDVNIKMNKVDGVFDIIDKTTDYAATISDKIVGAITSFVGLLFKKKKGNDNDEQE